MNEKNHLSVNTRIKQLNVNMVNHKPSIVKEYMRCKYLFLLLMPVLLWYMIFNYAPLYGIQIAFKDFIITKGIWGSPWIGLGQFIYMFTASPDFGRIMANTVIISSYHIIFGFPAPIILALMLNEIRSNMFKRVTQSLTYLPYFLSWVVLAGFMTNILSPSTGPVNYIIQLFGFDPVYFLGDKHWFRLTLVVTNMWKEVGWGSIIYLAALSNISIELYESATIDGASRWKQMIHITLPSIMPTIAIMFIFRIGGILNAGSDQILNLYNPAVYSVSDIIDTYVYRVGLQGMQYSFSTAVGLFKNVIAFVLVLLTDFAAKRTGQEGLL